AQLQLQELSPALRAALWYVVLGAVNSSTRRGAAGHTLVGDPWSWILRDEHVYRRHRMVDDFSARHRELQPALRSIFEHGDYIAVFGFLQYVIRHRNCPSEFVKA